MAKIAHASISEKGTINGIKGDQTGGEVCTREWYDKGWDTVMRPTTNAIAEKIAYAATAAALNENIGYGQSDRTTLYNEAIKVGFDPAKVKVKCNCDCSSLIAVICRYAGIAIDKDIYTGNEAAALETSGHFYKLTDKKYLTTDKYLKRGDILIKRYSHTATMIENGSGITGDCVMAPNTASSFTEKIAGTYRTTKICNLREKGNLMGATMAIIPMGKTFRNYGFYSIDSRGVTWLYGTTTYRGITYTGFISERCLE